MKIFILLPNTLIAFISAAIFCTNFYKLPALKSVRTVTCTSAKLKEESESKAVSERVAPGQSRLFEKKTGLTLRKSFIVNSILSEKKPYRPYSPFQIPLKPFKVDNAVQYALARLDDIINMGRKVSTKLFY